MAKSRFQLSQWNPDLVAPPVPWIVNRLWLGRGKIMAFFGAEKSGKSRILNWLIASMFSPAHTVLGEQVIDAQRPKRVLYLRGEEDQAEVQDRIKGYLHLMGDDEAYTRTLPIDFIDAMGMRLDSVQGEGSRMWFQKEYIESQRYDLILIDPLRRVHSGEENDNTAMAKMHNSFRYWTDRFGVGLGLLHHTGHLSDDADMERIATWSRGNTDLPSLVDGALYLHVLRDDGDMRKLKLLRAGRKRFGGPILIDDLGDDLGFRDTEDLR